MYTSYKSYEEKKKWAASLSPGDFVQDCNYEILEIKEIDVVYTYPAWTRKIKFPKFIPEFMWENDFLWNTWVVGFDAIIPYFASRNRFVDSTLILEGGKHCSSVHCCDEIDVGELILKEDRFRDKRNVIYQSMKSLDRNSQEFKDKREEIRKLSKEIKNLDRIINYFVRKSGM